MCIMLASCAEAAELEIGLACTLAAMLLCGLPRSRALQRPEMLTKGPGGAEFVGEDAEELTVMPGDQLIVLGEVDGWLQVRALDKTRQEITSVPASLAD